MPKKSTGISKTSAARMAAQRTAEENAKKVAQLEQGGLQEDGDGNHAPQTLSERLEEAAANGEEVVVWPSPAPEKQDGSETKIDSMLEELVALRGQHATLLEQAQALQQENTRLALEVQELRGGQSSEPCSPAADVTALVRNFALATDSLRSAAAATHKAERHRGDFGKCMEPICRASNVAWSEVGGAEGLQLALRDPDAWWEANGEDISALPTQQELLAEQNKAKAPRAGRIVEDEDLPFKRGRVGRAPVGFEERDPDDPGLPGTKGAQAVTV